VSHARLESGTCLTQITGLSPLLPFEYITSVVVVVVVVTAAAAAAKWERMTTEFQNL
jgi:hypothetical protein